MSASREKKQRQSAGPDQRALKAQQEQAERRRKTIVYSVVAAIAVVMVAALLVWRSGFFQSRAAAATVGGETLSTAQLSYYYYSVRSTFASYGILDTSKDDDEQIYDAENNVTYQDYFLETALDNVQKIYALADEAVKAGHTEDDIKAALESEIAQAKSSAAASGYSYSAYLRMVYGPYMNAGIFEQEVSRRLMSNLAGSEKQSELFNGYTQADLDAYYEEHGDDLDTIEYSYLYFSSSVSTKDEDGNELPEAEAQKVKDDAKAGAKEKAGEALEAVKGGATFESQADKYELASSSHADHAVVVGSGSINSSYRDQLLKLGKDKPELVETDSGCYVIAFHDRYLADEPTRDVRHILVRAESTTEEHEGHTHLVAPTEEAWADAKAKIDEIQAAWDAGDQTEDAFAKLANEKSDDSDGADGGLYERTYSGYFVPEFNDWVFDSARKPGDVGMVQHSEEEESTSGYYGYHLIYYVGENEPVWMGTARSSLANAAVNEWVDGLTADYPTAQAGGAGYLGK